MDKTESSSDYDFRQLSLMEEQLYQFESGKIKLAHLIVGLKSLRDCLRTIDEDWEMKFTAEWWTLEQVHAVALDRKKATFSVEDLALIKDAVTNLKALIVSVKNGLKPPPS